MAELAGGSPPAGLGPSVLKQLDLAVACRGSDPSMCCTQAEVLLVVLCCAVQRPLPLAVPPRA